MYNYNKDLIYFIKREGTTQNPYNNITENIHVLYEKAFLEEVPVQAFKVVVKVGNTTLTEVNREQDIKTTNQYYVNYKQGIVYFHSTKNNILATLTYRGQGVLLYPASRIYVDSEFGARDVVKTLRDLITEGAGALDAVQQVSVIISRAEIAISQINTVITSANSAITLINDKITEINTAEASRLSAENTRRTNENSRVSVELTRASAEATRLTSETSRNSAEIIRNNKETERQTKEADRLSKEIIRVNAETDRQTKESARITAESDRATKEAIRVTNETNRQTKESSRVTAENDRATKEAERLSKESERISKESDRVIKESERKSNEEIRVGSETSRATSESDRVVAETSRNTKENERIAKEAIRITNETSRNTKENERTTSEGVRVSSEAIRVTNENNRIASENAKLLSETGRVNAELLRESQEAQRQTDSQVAISNVNIAKASAEEATVETIIATNEAILATLEALGLIDKTSFKESFNVDSLYERNNIVSYNGSSYIAIQDTVGNMPTNQVYWGLLAQRGVDGTGSVSTVNNLSPDLNGNVVVTAEDMGAERIVRKGVADGYAGLDSNAKIPLSHIPDTLKQQTYVVIGETQRNALINLISGDKAYETSTGDSYIYDGSQWRILADADWENVSLEWLNIINKPNSTVQSIDLSVLNSHTHSNKEVLDKFSIVEGKLQYNGTNIGNVDSVNGMTGAITITSASVGAYSKVEVDTIITNINTNVNSKIPNSEKGVANGVAKLNSNGKVVDANGNEVEGKVLSVNGEIGIITGLETVANVDLKISNHANSDLTKHVEIVNARPTTFDKRGILFVVKSVEIDIPEPVIEESIDAGLFTSTDDGKPVDGGLFTSVDDNESIDSGRF